MIGRRVYVGLILLEKTDDGGDMPLNIDEKKTVVTEITTQLAKTTTMVVAEYRGVPVKDMTQLRAKARDQGVYIRVLKNTLVRRAVEGTSFSELSSEMTGPLIYSMSEDAVAAAKVLHEFAKTQDKLVLKAGTYKGKLMNAEAVRALASIPAYKDLIAMLLGVMQAPVSGMARVLAAIADKKQQESASVVA